MRKLILVAAAAATTLVVPASALASTSHKPVKTVKVCEVKPKHGKAHPVACKHVAKIVYVVVTRQGPRGPQGPQGAQGQPGTNGANGRDGQNGANGSDGTNGANGATGPTGAAGSAGPVGANAPFTYTYTGIHALDSGDCGNDWAHDSFDAKYSVVPQADGSYLIVKVDEGTFTTIAGTQEPNDPGCISSQTGGVTGTFQGVETWTVASPGPGQAASFDPTATPDLSNMTGNEPQNAAFQAAFFPGSTYAGETNYDFVYHTASSGSWVDSNTPANNTGNIAG